MHLDGKVAVTVNAVSGVPQGSVQDHCCLYFTPPSSSTLLRILLSAMWMILQSMQLFQSAFTSSSQGIAELAAINSWCLKWHMRLNPKKTKFLVVSRSLTITPGYGDFILVCAEL